MTQGGTMPRDRIRKTYTLGPDDLARLDRIAAIKSAGNSSRALSLALEIAALVMELPAAAGAATAADALAAWRRGLPGKG